MKPKIDTRLSYSSGEVVANCSQKYFHKKIASTPFDPDYRDDYDAFNIGKAFHLVQEKLRHSGNPDRKLVLRACKVNKCEESTALVHAMCLKYSKLHKKIGLECVATEFEISNEKFVGFVDVVLKDKKGNWWVVDLKTASRIMPSKIARLSSDVQLNLYSYFYKEIATMFKLNPEKFKGARYRVTTKSDISQARGEGYVDFVKRIYTRVNSYEVVVPREVMTLDKTFKMHLKNHDLTMKLRDGRVKPKPNYGYCDSYFKPCEYWSQCHGDTYSNLTRKLNLVSADD